MKTLWNKYRFLIARRISQLSILLLFAGGYLYHWKFNGVKILVGNLSSAKLLETIPLSDPYATLQILSTGHMLEADVLIGAGITLLIYGLFFGRAFCSWVCPINLVTDAAGWLRSRLNLDKSGVRLWTTRKIRYWILGISFILSLIFGIEAFEVISPISVVHRGIIFGMGLGWLLIFAVFLFDLLFMKHGFCGHICPLGAFYSLTTRYSVIRVNHIVEECTHCMDCFKVCPEPQVLSMVTKRSEPVLSGECTNCAKCIEICPTPSLVFGWRFQNKANLLNKS